MSIDYHLSRVTNAHDGKQYIVKTARVPGGDWQTAVLKPGFFGAFRRLMTLYDLTEKQASLVHDQVKAIVANDDPMHWRLFRHTKVDRWKIR
jgi:hypothetical protein